MYNPNYCDILKTFKIIIFQVVMILAQKSPLPDFDEYRIKLVTDAMKKIRKTSSNDAKPMVIARKAFDEIQRTGEYEFGQKLFQKLKDDFTTLRDELSPMLNIIEKSLNK